MEDFYVFAHRGAKGTEPENTLLAFEKAVESGAKWIETDIYTVEDELIIIHDDRLERTTNGQGYFQELSLDYILSLNAGKDQKIPRLDDVLDLLEGKCNLNLELKGQGTARLVAEKLKDRINSSSWKKENFLISSFNHHELVKFIEFLPNIKLGALTMSIPIDYTKFASNLGAWSIHASSEFVNKRFVDDAHSRGLKFFLYTVNYEDDLERFRRLGIDGIFTDFPEKFCRK